ncbi:putative alpha-L-arabinofuranosidase C [Psilocybe cubensis]|uniref:Alpha-L-arabinofuranosidase C n=1 Tax=Psilocybe cubensis TaxID=181762 RepID=A0ACB8GJ95_PSICU|nr:putative alpha-L-arabinofuranosidase C [Psilocybe cubensis]KAH9475530.1 putative alpha-L-arabinofuranosidase C [Psilocybe cubensis]
MFRLLVGQMESHDYAKKAFQWAKALRLLDPSIKLISCGENGYSDWDRVTLRKLAPVVDFHSIHLYTTSHGKHLVNVMGPAAAEKGIEITRSLIDLAKIEGGLSKDLTVCFDEWNVWDPVRAPGEKGAEEHYDLSDALGASLSVHVDIPTPALVYTGPTSPKFVQDLSVHTPDSAKLTKLVDVSAVLASVGQGKEIRIAIVNKSDDMDFKVPILFGPQATVKDEFTVYEIWHEDLKANNGFDGERVRTVVKNDRLTGSYNLKSHSFQSIERFYCQPTIIVLIISLMIWYPESMGTPRKLKQVIFIGHTILNAIVDLVLIQSVSINSIMSN